MSGAFIASLEWVPSANNRVFLPDDSGTIALALSPSKILTVGTTTITMPASAQAFDYVLCAAGGGGGNGGTVCGGGGAAAGEFVTGTILISELISALSLTQSQLTLTVTVGDSTTIGERGANSSLAIGANTIAIAQGGYGGLAGTAKQGSGPWSGGTTYTNAGGVGQVEQRYGARSFGGDPITSTNVRLNPYGDGGNGGAINAAGSLGKAGYFSIQFF